MMQHTKLQRHHSCSQPVCYQERLSPQKLVKLRWVCLRRLSWQVHWLTAIIILVSTFFHPANHCMPYRFCKVISFWIFLLIRLQLGLEQGQGSGQLHSHLTPLPSSENDVWSVCWMENSANQLYWPVTIGSPMLWLPACVRARHYIAVQLQ